MTALRLALTGDLEREFEAELRRAEKAVTGAMRRAGRGLKEELRTQTRQAGLGDRLPRTWRDRTFPRTGDSLEAAAVVDTKAPQIMRAFGEGATIRSRDGLFLAIPTGNAPRRGIGGKRITPSNFPEERFGRLRFVYRRNGPSLLVVDDVRIGRSGAVRRPKNARTKSGRLRKGVATAVMFVLVPQVRLKKRLDLNFSAEKWERRIPALLDSEFRRLDAADGGAA